MDDNVEFILKGRGSDISSDFLEPIVIPIETHVAKLGVKNFACYNNIPNIEAGKNNQVKIKVPGGDYKLFTLDTGAYELSTIAEQLVEWIEITYPHLRDVETNFKLIGNEATSKAELWY